MTEREAPQGAARPGGGGAGADEPAGKRRGRRGRATMRRRPDQPCLNCGDDTFGNYCPNCGQAKREVAVSMAALVMDVLEDQLIINKALPRTAGNLIFKPGKLTVEYINGRIVRYIAPFRLYLVTSVVFFLLLSFIGLRALERMGPGGSPAAASPDSLAAELTRSREALSAIDTASLPPVARAGIAAAEEAVRRQAAAADSAARQQTEQMPPVAPLPPGGVQPWAANIRITTGFGSGADSTIHAHIRERYGHLPELAALRAFLRDYAEYMPHAVFLLLPVFPLVLKLLYIRRNRYYAEHFVFSLHVHAFMFLMFIVALLARQWIVANLLFLWVAVYIWIAMKRVYGQGFFRTTVKYFVLGWTYFILLTLSMTATGFVALLL